MTLHGHLDLTFLRYRRIRLQVFYLYKVVPKRHPPAKDFALLNISVKPCSAKDIRALRFPRFREMNVDARNLAVAARFQNEIVAFVMLSDQEILKDADFKKRLDIAQFLDFDGAYIWGAYTFPAYRRMGIMKHVLSHMLSIAVEKGYSVVYAIIEKSNLPSQRAFVGVGFVPTRVIYFLNSPILSLLWQRKITKTK